MRVPRCWRWGGNKFILQAMNNPRSEFQLHIITKSIILWTNKARSTSNIYAAPWMPIAMYNYRVWWRIISYMVRCGGVWESIERFHINQMIWFLINFRPWQHGRHLNGGWMEIKVSKWDLSLLAGWPFLWLLKRNLLLFAWPSNRLLW